MKLKLDENLPPDVLTLLAAEGHDVSSVHLQSLDGTSDSNLIDVCVSEERCLVTMDSEFGNPLVFPPARHRGIAVLRVKGRCERAVILEAVTTFALAIRSASIDRSLWTVEPGRVRVYQPLNDPVPGIDDPQGT